MSNIAESRAWIDVDLDAVRENFLTLRRAAGPRSAAIAMVKADAYGLGAERMVRTLDPLAPWGYGVAAAAEGVALRSYGVERPVVIFGPLPPQAVAQAAAAGLTATISDLAGLERWAAAAAAAPRPLDFHVEIDTGMGRAGFDWRDTARWGEAVKSLVGPRLRWTGVFTHFHGADAAEAAPTATQWKRLNDALAQLPVSREDLMVHACNSAAALRFPAYVADGYRPGIFLYGGHPAPGVAGVPAPRPVAAVRARIVLVREVPPATTVGYGATHKARGWERWATVAIGYGDGLPRSLSNRGSALVAGRRVPIVGRISMDMTVVDISDVPEVREGDVATFIGEDGGEALRLDDVAAQAGTIGYEILTGLTRRLPRVERGAHGGE